jgi:hypothetical protein
MTTYMYMVLTLNGILVTMMNIYTERRLSAEGCSVHVGGRTDQEDDRLVGDSLIYYWGTYHIKLAIRADKGELVKRNVNLSMSDSFENSVSVMDEIKSNMTSRIFARCLGNDIGHKLHYCLLSNVVNH